MKWTCGLVIGEADSAENAEKLARAFRNCPYTAFVGVFEDKLVWALCVPEGHLPWLRSLHEQPEALGLKRATVLLTGGEKIFYPQCALRLPEKKLTVAPCGALCERCELYKSCPGCPATIFYRGTYPGGEDVSESGADVPSG